MEVRLLPSSLPSSTTLSAYTSSLLSTESYGDAEEGQAKCNSAMIRGGAPIVDLYYPLAVMTTMSINV